MKRHVKQSDFVSASILYNENQDLFNSAKEARRRASELNELTNYLNTGFSERIASQQIELASIDFDTLYPANWRAVKLTISSANELVIEYESHAILQKNENTLPALRELSDQIQSTTGMIVSQRRNAFLAYDHSLRETFFVIYPDGYEDDYVRRRKIVAQAGTDLWPVLKSMSMEDQLYLVDAWTKGKPNNFGNMFGAELRLVIANSYYEKLIQQWLQREDGDPTEFLAGVAAAHTISLIPSEAISSRLLLIATAPSGDFPLKLSFDRTLPFTFRNEVPRDLTPGLYDLVIVLGIKRIELREKLVETRTTRSKYKERMETKTNPAYLSAQSAYSSAIDIVNIASSHSNRAHAAYSACQAQITGWNSGQCHMLAANAGDAARQLSESRDLLNRAQRRLGGTEPTVTKPVYRDYDVPVSRVLLEKIVSGKAAIIMPEVRQARVVEFSLNKRTSFDIAANVHPTDSGAASKLDTKNDLKSEESKRFEVNVLDVLAELGSARADISPVKELNEFLVSIVDPKRPASSAIAVSNQVTTVQAVRASHPAINGVVVVQSPLGNLGSGFYVAEHLLLTNYHVVVDSSFVEIEFFDGRSTTGQVISTDIDRDLALVRTSLSGQPLVLYTKPSLPLGESVIAIGHPSGLKFSLTKGIISAVREQQSTSSMGLGANYLFVQTDTAISPGNSGGPLLLENKVIGINTEKVVDVRVEGVGFALHYAEIARFLAASMSN